MERQELGASIEVMLGETIDHDGNDDGNDDDDIVDRHHEQLHQHPGIRLQEGEGEINQQMQRLVQESVKIIKNKEHVQSQEPGKSQKSDEND